MSIEPKAPTKTSGTPLAIAILSAAIALFLASQINAASQQSKLMTWQMKNGETQLANAKTNEDQYGEAIKQQDTVVQQVIKVQQQYQDLFEDLLKLSDEGDADAKAIVEHWKISRNKPKETEKKDEKK